MEICSQCKEIKEINSDNYYFSKQKGYFLKPCKECVKKNNLNRYKTNESYRCKTIERSKKSVKKYYYTNPEYRKKRIDCSSRWQKENKDRVNELTKKRQKIYISELKDYHVRHLFISKYKRQPLPSEIDIYRLILITKRIINEHTK